MSTPPSTGHGIEPLLDWLASMRATNPVWRDGRGVVHVFGFDEVRTVLHDWAAYSSDRSALMPGEDRLASGNLTMMDPPEHRSLRGVVSRVFTPRVTKTLRPRVTEVASALLDGVPGDEFDLIEHLAHPLPVIVIAELLGVPAGDRELFREWSAGFGRGEPEALRALHSYLVGKCRERRGTPGDDLITLLASQLDDDQVASLGGLLLLAGHLTTTMLLSSAVECLLAHPEAADELRADPGLLPGVVTEVLRLRPPFTQVSRITTRPVTLGGLDLPPGTLVLAWVVSANHDERHFPSPHRFDPRRPADRHLAFGHGIHFCLGAPLARLETEIALGLLLSRFADITSTGEPMRYYEAPVFGAKRLVVKVRR